MPLFSRNRGKSLQAASLDAAILKWNRFKLRIGFWSVPRPHLCLLLLVAACIALGAVFVFASLSLAAQGDCGEQNRSPQQTGGINTLCCRNYKKMSCDAAYGRSNEYMSLREDPSDLRDARSFARFFFCFVFFQKVVSTSPARSLELHHRVHWWKHLVRNQHAPYALYTDKEAKLKLVARRPVMEKQLHLRSTPTLVSSFTSSGILEILLKNRPRSAGHQWSRCSSRIGNLLPSCGVYGCGSLHWVSEYWLVTSSGKRFLWWELRKSRQSSEWKPTSSCGAALAQLWSTSTSSTSVKWS